MSQPTKSKAWILQNKPHDHAVLSGPDATFSLQEQNLEPLKDGQLLLKTRYISNDPAQRGWIDANINPEELYVPPVETGDAMRARGIGEVIESKSSKFQKGQLVAGPANWREYFVIDEKEAQALQDIPGVKPTQFLGALGSTGLTAYVGLIKVAEAKKGDVVVVSGAAGATGSIVVQLAKHVVGAGKVIGIAGSDDKCKWVKSLGADVTINYKQKDWIEQLRKATEGGVDVYYDNVGGETLDFMLTRMRNYGKIAACGAIADYNIANKNGLKNWFSVIMNRINIKGFIVMDFLADGQGAKMVGELSKAAKEGKLKLTDENETVVETKFEDIPKTWTKLFEGGNTGKLITALL